MTKNAGQPEDIVKAKLGVLLSRWFLVYPKEVSGIYESPDGEKVHLRPDYWCKPKPFLVALGWPDKPFAIEVKGYELQDGKRRTATNVIHQAILYTMTRFPTLQKPEGVRPNWVLLYPPLSVLLSKVWRSVNPLLTFYDGYESALQHFAAKWRVGELVIDKEKVEVRIFGRRAYDSVRGKYGDTQLGKTRDRVIH